MLASTGIANAAPMDFALSRFGIVPGNVGCSIDSPSHCPDQALFERLMLQFGASMTLPAATPAATLGLRGFSIGVDTTLTTIDSTQNQWSRGTEGDNRSVGTLANSQPDSVLVWNRVRARKGLPFGLEVDVSLAQAASTQAWLVGVGLKWAIVEGFRTGIGRAPDIAIRAGLAAAPGTVDASLTSITVDLLLSKPIVMDRAWVVTPSFALQSSWLFADSDLVDLTPDVDALEQCDPAPGHQPNATMPATLQCQGDGRDYANTVAFQSFTHFNLRLAAGAEVRYRAFVVHASFSYDLLSPTVAYRPDPEPALSRQLSINLGAGVSF